MAHQEEAVGVGALVQFNMRLDGNNGAINGDDKPKNEAGHGHKPPAVHVPAVRAARIEAHMEVKDGEHCLDNGQPMKGAEVFKELSAKIWEHNLDEGKMEDCADKWAI